MKKLTIIQYSIAKTALSTLRDTKTTRSEYRQATEEIARLLLQEATKDLTIEKTTITTPLTKTDGFRIKDTIVFVVILRAGLSLLPTAVQFLPFAAVGFAGLKRDEKTAIAHEYYWNMPPITKKTTVIVLDPMLATGGSATHTIEKLQGLKPKEIILVNVIAAPEGIKALHTKFPHVHIITAAVDEKLNAQKFIVPGLGDFGDRYFGTE